MLKKGLSREITKKIKPVNNYKDDIFIVCASFEERTGAVVEKLAEKYRVARSFIFKYDEKDRTNLRDQNFEKLKDGLLQYSENVYPIICDHHDPLDGISKFQELCKNRNIPLKNKNITIDITTFTKQYLLVLFKFIEKQKPKTIRLFYTEPEDYAVKWNKPLSYGLIDIVSVPTYGGHFYVEKENLLVLLLGYEGDRAYGIWERFTPHKTIILIGRPSFRNAWEGRVEKFNKKIISKFPEDFINYIPTLDPFEVSKNLDNLIKHHMQKFNIYISPLGPKPQVVGCYLCIRKHPYVQIVYAIPKSHEEEYFSKQVGKIWEYR
ncbi:MAG: hypothetical protein ACTSRL_21710 [Candidatus Helarchaeota archaeon]